MLARGTAGHQRGPGRGRERRHDGTQAGARAFREERLQEGHDTLFHQGIENGKSSAVQTDKQRPDTHCTRLVVLAAPPVPPRCVSTKLVSSSIDRSRWCWPISASSSAKGIGV